MGYKVLAINPGSTSTKVALYEDEQPLLELTLRHSPEELSQFAEIADQHSWRRDIVLKALEEKGIALSELSAVIGRGGLTKPIEGGCYEVNEKMLDDLRNPWMVHACNLGGLIAGDIAREAGIKAYIADPAVVDELDEISRVTGLPQVTRHSIFHALNQKAIARLHAKKVGKRYEEMNLIVVHLGGGISVGAHSLGRVIDVNNALNGDGPFAPERAGTIPATSLVDICFSGEYTKAQIGKMLAGKGGIVALLETNSMMEVENRALEGEPKAKLVFDAMCYNVGKQIGAMAAVLCGKIDNILITGGIARSEYVIERLKEQCGFLAPISVYPGENELESLVENALGVLRGELTPKQYV